MNVIRECATKGCYTQTSSVTGYCSKDGECRDSQNKIYRHLNKHRKHGAVMVSSQKKAACGASEHEGSIPSSSTDDLVESLRDQLDVLTEELEDAKAEISRLRTFFTNGIPSPFFSIPDTPVPGKDTPPAWWDWGRTYPQDTYNPVNGVYSSNPNGAVIPHNTYTWSRIVG